MNNTRTNAARIAQSNAGLDTIMHRRPNWTVGNRVWAYNSEAIIRQGSSKRTGDKVLKAKLSLNWTGPVTNYYTWTYPLTQGAERQNTGCPYCTASYACMRMVRPTCRTLPAGLTQPRRTRILVYTTPQEQRRATCNYAQHRHLPRVRCSVMVAYGTVGV